MVKGDTLLLLGTQRPPGSAFDSVTSLGGKWIETSERSTACGRFDDGRTSSGLTADRKQ